GEIARQARPGILACEGEECGGDGAGIRFGQVGCFDGGAQFALKSAFEELPGGEQVSVPFKVGLEVRQGSVGGGVEREQGELGVVTGDDASRAAEFLAGEGEVVGTGVRPGEVGEHGLAQRAAREEGKLRGLQSDRQGVTPVAGRCGGAVEVFQSRAIQVTRGRPLTQLCREGKRSSGARMRSTWRGQLEARRRVAGGGSKAIRCGYTLARDERG